MAELKNLTVVTDTVRCKEIASRLLKEKVLAVDCQGVHLGAKGTLTLLQIGTSKEEVYLFDVHHCDKLLSVDELKRVLESEDIVKVMYNCSKDSGALRSHFNISLQKVFDVKVAHVILEERKGRQLIPKLWLDRVCKIYVPNASVSENKEEIMRKYAKEDSGFWEKSPLKEDMKLYAAGNVRHLIKVYEKQNSLIGQPAHDFQGRMVESINLQTDNEYKRQRERRNAERVSKIISSIDKECDTTISLTSFEEEGDKWLALQRFDLREDQQHSELIKRLKKEMIEYELNKIDEGIKDASSFIVGPHTFNLLFRAAGHSDKSISKRAKTIKNKVEGIVRNDIMQKYTEETEIRYLTFNEQAVLRNLRIEKWKELRYPKNVNLLFWRLWGEEVNREEKALNDQAKNYKVSEWFLEKLQILVTIPSIPRSLREKVNTFLQNVNELRLA